ncbi:MAG: 6,7-dimethyl-8-ribityllumazine synthase [Muribaculaceae bacterium]|nr:6,7-dimethyl-8-ribityllumazine synthase [Muribaculaceae bacterium]
MATELNKDAELIVPRVSEYVKGNFYIITAKWNEDVTSVLHAGAYHSLWEAGIDKKNIIEWKVPGTVELINAAALALNHPETTAVIVIGCVIRGETPHFDYVCQIAAQGVAQLNALGKAPVVFGVLTVDNMQQALDRADGILGNKGAEAGAAAVEMANLHALAFV